MLIALGDLIPASPETITSDSAAQLTGGDPWIAGLEGFFCLEVFMNPGNTLNFGFQDPEFCVRFCLFIFSSSTTYIYMSFLAFLDSEWSHPWPKKTVLESNNRSCITVSLNYHQ